MKSFLDNSHLDYLFEKKKESTIIYEKHEEEYGLNNLIEIIKKEMLEKSPSKVTN